MNNPTLDLMNNHVSIRHYKPDPLPVSLVETIVTAAQHASTSSALQAYSVIAVTDPEKRGQLSQLCGDQEHVRQAPLFLAWCADLARLDRICAIRGYKQVTEYTENFLIGAFDALLAAQNAALAAESLGLGICYIGSIRRKPKEVISLLQLPRFVFPVVGMTVGWPAAEVVHRPRLPMEVVLHWEHYDPVPKDEALCNYNQQMISTGIYKGRQVPVPGKSSEMELVGWLEQSARRVSHEERTGLRKAIEEQGFALN